MRLWVPRAASNRVWSSSSSLSSRSRGSADAASSGESGMASSRPGPLPRTTLRRSVVGGVRPVDRAGRARGRFRPGRSGVRHHGDRTPRVMRRRVGDEPDAQPVPAAPPQRADHRPPTTDRSAAAEAVSGALRVESSTSRALPAKPSTSSALRA